MPKKIEKYVPQTVTPRSSLKLAALVREGGYTPTQVVQMVRECNAESSSTYYSRTVRMWDAGEVNASNFHLVYNESYINNIYSYISYKTAGFKEINDKFLAEFDSREDLQEIYALAVKGRYHLRLLNLSYVETNPAGGPPSPYTTRPESFIMYNDIVSWSNEARQKIELSRETPYMEGDLVVLRQTSVGNGDYDPMFIPYWQRTEKGETPDKTVPRLGTVISVTENVNGWRATRGSKIIKVMWVGIGEGKIQDVPEKHIKFHERPTFKNGMKVRK